MKHDLIYPMIEKDHEFDFNFHTPIFNNFNKDTNSVLTCNK